MRKRMMLLGVCTGLMALHTQWLQGALPDEPEVKTGKWLSLSQSDKKQLEIKQLRRWKVPSQPLKLWLDLNRNVEGDLATFHGSTSGADPWVQPEVGLKAGLGSGDIVTLSMEKRYQSGSLGSDGLCVEAFL